MKIQEMEDELQQVEEQLLEATKKLPNWSHPDVRTHSKNLNRSHSINTASLGPKKGRTTTCPQSGRRKTKIRRIRAQVSSRAWSRA